MPGIGIAIGGLLTQWFTWESCFYFTALFGAVMLGFSTTLPETATSIDRNSLKFSSIIEGYELKLRNKRLIISAAMMGCGAIVIYVFASKAPFIGIKLIGLSPDEFGVYSLIPPIGTVIGSFIAAALIGRFKIMNLIFVGVVVSTAGTFLMLVPFAISHISAAALFLPMVLIFAAQSVAYANVTSYGLATAQNKSNASAMLNFINIGLAVIAVFFSEFIFPESALMLPMFLLAAFILMLFLWTRLRKIENTV